MITFNGKPLCDHCFEQPIAHSYDGWVLCNDCLLSYSRHCKLVEDNDPAAYDAYLDELLASES